MKKILFLLVVFLLPFCVYAVSIDVSGMNDDIASLLTSLSDDWPSNMDSGRLSVIREAGLMIGKGTTYLWGGGHTNGCIEGVPQYLDCSGYVSLAFHRGGALDVACGIDTNSFIHDGLFEEISESELRPGDIALNNGGSGEHIGLYIGKKNGLNMYFHSSNHNGVSGPQVREGNGYFTYFMRYKNWNEVHYSAPEVGNDGVGGEITGSLKDPYPNFNLALTTGDFTCENIFYGVTKDGTKEEKNLKKILDMIFRVMIVLGPVLLIALTISDFARALSLNKDDLKKVFKKTLKRLVILVILIMIPLIINLLFQLFGLYDLSNCGIS